MIRRPRAESMIKYAREACNDEKIPTTNIQYGDLPDRGGDLVGGWRLPPGIDRPGRQHLFLSTVGADRRPPRRHRRRAGRLVSSQVENKVEQNRLGFAD